MPKFSPQGLAVVLIVSAFAVTNSFAWPTVRAAENSALDSKLTSPQDRSYTARAAYEANPNDVVAATNFAILQLQIGDREFAQSIFSSAAKLHPLDYLAALGLAQALANDPEQGVPAALKQLDKVEKIPQAAGVDSFTRLVLTADCYLSLNAFPRAFALYRQAYLLKPTDYTVSEKCCRTALASGQLDLAKTFLPQVLAKESADQALLILLAQNSRTLRAGPISNAIMESARTNFSSDADFYYRLGRAFQGDANAAICFNRAVTISPDEGKFVLAQAALLTLAHKESAALAQLKTMAGKSAMQEPSPRRTLVAGLIKAGVELLSQPGKHSYQVSTVEITSLSCHCKVAAINYILRGQPGVVFAQVPEGKGPRNLLICAADQNPALIWSKMAKEAKYKLLPKASPITDFPALYALASGNFETVTVAPKPHYAFQALPLRRD